ncbi:protein of unknown function [Sphingobacterium nematocida]|uniref:DUF4861 domain-containing protein n=1 Tax=Sphingobacterium nematocida TaxID=1513896 RepID=A0A1T5DIA5_9SPHI|nr:DUF4861 family protein [Sphingobacterium nematocida]SKB71465.1 protein of unknown function [Sphingobacterium nematocida]
MKAIFFTLAISCLGHSLVQAQKFIEITNSSDKNRLEIVSIPYKQFSRHFTVDSIFNIVQKNAEAVYPYQLEKLGGSEIKNVLIQVDIAPKSSLKLVIKNEKPTVIQPKTYARYVPERFDDFAWENDVVAFRLYGKALEGRGDDAQGMDYWSKRTKELIIDKWYKSEDYHQDHGDGLDYYSVGQTLGVGDMALFLGNQIQYTKHYRAYQILDNGPLRTTFKLSFETQNFDGQQITFSKTISLDAGQNFNKITIDLANNTAKNTPIVLGLAKRNETNPKYEFDQENNTLIYWEPTIKNFGQTGTALIVPKRKVNFLPNDTKQFLLKTVVKNHTSLTYYNGAAWNRAGKITSFDDWEDFVEDYSESLQTPLKVKLK